jgi:hypothetical protein
VDQLTKDDAIAEDSNDVRQVCIGFKGGAAGGNQLEAVHPDGNLPVQLHPGGGDDRSQSEGVNFSAEVGVTHGETKVTRGLQLNVVVLHAVMCGAVGTCAWATTGERIARKPPCNALPGCLLRLCVQVYKVYVDVSNEVDESDRPISLLCTNSGLRAILSAFAHRAL